MTFLHVSPQLYAWPENADSAPRCRTIPTASEHAENDFPPRCTVCSQESRSPLPTRHWLPPVSHSPENSHASPGNSRPPTENLPSFGILSETTDLRFSVHMKKSSGQANRSPSLVCFDNIASGALPELDKSLPAQKATPAAPDMSRRTGEAGRRKHGGAGEIISPACLSCLFCL